MKRYLLSTAMLGALTVPAFAQDQTIFREAPDALEIRASDFMGMRVYASEAAVEGEEFEGLQEGWEDLGEIGDIIMDRDGQVQAVLVDIGGFLGIGERTVAVSMDALQLVSDSETAEDVNDFFLVMNANREALESAPEYVTAEGEGMTAEQAAEETDEAIEEGGEEAAAAGAAVEGATEEAGDNVTVTTVEVTEETEEAGEEIADEAADAGEEIAEEADQADMTDTQEDQAEAADESADAQEEAAEETAQASDEAADESADQAEVTAEGTATETEMAADETAEAATTETTTEEAPARTPVEREGFVAAGAEDFTADRLQGAAVYDANDERVGEVGEILLSDDGQVSDLIVDVGGFLGLGEKPVALEMTSLDILRQDGGEEIRVYVTQTEEELEAMERYEAQ